MKKSSLITTLNSKYNREVERVGFVLKDGSVVEIDNIAIEPDLGFEVAAEDLIKYEDEMAATWHTHPRQDSNLSQDDYRAFTQWPKLQHYVVGDDGIRCFKVNSKGLLVEHSTGET